MEEKLVSVVVITYNSAQYVEETLESAKAQTYKNIELIIADDCSTDNTVAICEKWLKLNHQRFVRTDLLTSETNTGVSANCNRGLYASKGEWLKFIAGDDMLLIDCIDNYIDFIATTNSRFIFAIPSILIQSNNDDLKMQMETFYRDSDRFFSLSPQKQLKYMLLNQIPVCPPTMFSHRNSIIEMNGFDQKFACEDLPLFLCATHNGHQLILLKKKTVCYRIHENQLSIKGKTGLINEFWFYEQLRIKKKYFTRIYILCNPLLYFEYLVQMLSKTIILKTGNKKSSSILFNFLRFCKRSISFSYIIRENKF